jgi:hypothetical protein
MGAPKKGPRRHLHIDPYVYLDKGERVDKALAWFDSQPTGQRTRLCWELIIAAVNGELGVAPVVSSVADADDHVAQAALESLLKNMAMDEDD